MWTRLAAALALSAVSLALAVMPADAALSQVGILTIACDGTNQHLTFSATGLGVSVNRFIQAAEVSVIDSRGALLYMVVRAQGDDMKQIITMGSRATLTRADFISSLIQVPTNAQGQVPFAVDAGCLPGAPILAIVTVYFFS